jgi:hypothetical protein
MTELDGEASDYSFEIYAYDDWDVVGRPLTLTQSGEVELEIISQSKVADGYSVVVEATNNTGNKASELLIRVGVGNNNKDSIIIDNLTLEPGATQSYTVFINSDVSGLSAYADFAKDGGVPGDVNFDGKVDRKDLTRLAQYFARWNVEINTTTSDANGDGKISAIDARLVLKIAASGETPTAEELLVMDTNNDGKVTAIDARNILKMAASA